MEAAEGGTDDNLGDGSSRGGSGGGDGRRRWPAAGTNQFF